MGACQKCRFLSSQEAQPEDEGKANAGARKVEYYATPTKPPIPEKQYAQLTREANLQPGITNESDEIVF